MCFELAKVPGQKEKISACNLFLDFGLSKVESFCTCVIDGKQCLCLFLLFGSVFEITFDKMEKYVVEISIFRRSLDSKNLILQEI